MMHLSGIFVYPIKAMGGISLETASIEERGLALDRRWMLIDEQDQAITQRQIPELSLCRLRIVEDGITVFYQDEQLFIPQNENRYPEQATVQVWDDRLNALIASPEINDWFSKQLGHNCRLAYQGLSSVRLTSTKYTDAREVSLADGYPYLLLSEESISFLNKKLEKPISIDRFRANFIVSGAYPHAEDDFHFFQIGHTGFKAVKPCARCSVITINQSTGEAGKEPLKSLATYRKRNNKIYFGQNLVYDGIGPAKVSVGDQVKAIQKRSNE